MTTSKLYSDAPKSEIHFGLIEEFWIMEFRNTLGLADLLGNDVCWDTGQFVNQQCTCAMVVCSYLGSIAFLSIYVEYMHWCTLLRPAVL